MADSLRRPYPVTVSLVIFLALVPFYLVIPGFRLSRAVHVPELPVDRLLPVQPAWALVYAAVYLCLIILPVFVVRQHDLLRRTVSAYLTIWVTAYAFFALYPTIAPRPDVVTGDGFAAWWLRVLYVIDTPYNCFPSLHVAHSFVSALAIHLVHRRLGFAALLCATLVAVSTLFAKQHYLLDVIAGVVLAVAAYLPFLRTYPRQNVDELDRRTAPMFALVTVGIVSLGLAGLGVAFLITGGA